jgi:hypothetical protein
MANIDLVYQKCSKIFTVKSKSRNRKYCSRKCINDAFAGEGNPAYGKTYRTKETCPE